MEMTVGAKLIRSVSAVAALALSGLIALSGCETPPSEVPTAQSIRGLKPSGKVTMTQANVSGTVLGSGALIFKGRTYPFTLTGQLIGLGALSTLQASGDVYKLTDVSQFSGPYIQGSGPLAVSVRGAGELWLKNRNGVIMRLTAAQAGLMFSSGQSELFIELTR
jgi:hypothetical protein